MESRMQGLWQSAAIGCRIFLGLMFLTGGLSKLTEFMGVMGPVWLEERLAEHGLGLFARFIGWSEALIGLLLLSGRFSTLGAIMLVPLLVNILMVTVSMNWQGTPYVIAGFLAMNAYLLIYDYPRIRMLFLDDPEMIRATTFRRRNCRADLACLLGMAAVIAGPIVRSSNTFACYLVMGLGFLIMGAAVLAEDDRPAVNTDP